MDRFPVTKGALSEDQQESLWKAYSVINPVLGGAREEGEFFVDENNGTCRLMFRISSDNEFVDQIIGTFDHVADARKALSFLERATAADFHHQKD